VVYIREQHLKLEVILFLIIQNSKQKRSIMQLVGHMVGMSIKAFTYIEIED
tara:strand:- start:89 stop:241 length:153 start_codon:yes stop_codon:yes gene_type:complete